MVCGRPASVTSKSALDKPPTGLPRWCTNTFSSTSRVVTSIFAAPGSEDVTGDPAGAVVAGNCVEVWASRLEARTTLDANLNGVPLMTSPFLRTGLLSQINLVGQRQSDLAIRILISQFPDGVLCFSRWLWEIQITSDRVHRLTVRQRFLPEVL